MFDTGLVGALTSRRVHAAHDEAGVEAANQANAILDSLDMPQVAPVTKSIAVVPSTASEASDKGDESSDESVTELNVHETEKMHLDKGVATRRSRRLAT